MNNEQQNSIEADDSADLYSESLPEPESILWDLTKNDTGDHS